MIKRIIFDIDGTLIDWTNEYWNGTIPVFAKYGINFKDYAEELDRAWEELENELNILSKDKFIEKFSKITKKTLPNNFMEEFLNNFILVNEKKDEEKINALEYLSNKYELVIYSNAFRINQDIRLKKSNLYNYFNYFYYGDEIPMKPSKEGFLIACGDNKPEECLLIGDNLNIDYYGALNCGINAILYDPNNKHLDINNRVSSFKEIKDYL